MTRYVTYDQTGRIFGVISSDPETIPHIVPSGLSYLASEIAEIDQHWVDHEGVVVEYSSAAKVAIRQAPEGRHQWVPVLGAWVDLRTIEELRTAAIERVKKVRDEKLNGGFEWDGSRFDSDTAVAQPRLLGLFTTALAGGIPPEGYAWRLADNTWRVLSAADAANVWGAFQSHMSALFAAFAAHEQALLAADTVQALAEYDVTQGWPV